MKTAEEVKQNFIKFIEDSKNLFNKELILFAIKNEYFNDLFVEIEKTEIQSPQNVVIANITYSFFENLDITTLIEESGFFKEIETSELFSRINSFFDLYYEYHFDMESVEGCIKWGMENSIRELILKFLN